MHGLAEVLRKTATDAERCMERNIVLKACLCHFVGVPQGGFLRRRLLMHGSPRGLSCPWDVLYVYILFSVVRNILVGE